MNRCLYRLCRLCFWLAIVVGLPVHAVAQSQTEADSLGRLLAAHQDRDSTRARLLIDLALALEREDPGRSVGFAMDAREIATEISHPLLEADAFQQAGNSYGILGAFLRQRECYLTARKLYQDVGNHQGEIAVLNNLGTVSVEEKNYGYGRQYLLQALKMTQSHQEDRYLAAIYNNLGNLYDGLARHDSALIWYRAAYDDVRTKTPDPEVESIILVNIGNTYAALGERDHALQIYRSCIPYKKDINDRYGLSELYLNLGNTLFEVGKFDSALIYLEEALRFADTIQAMEMQELIHREMASVYDTLGKPGIALWHSFRTIALLDSLHQQEASSISQATEMRIQAENTIHERELSSSKAALEQQDRLRLQRYVTIGTVIGLVLISLLLLILYRRYQERRRAATELEARVLQRTNELSQANQSLQAALSALEASNRDLNTFIYRSSHDLRSPLTSIAGLLDIIHGSLQDHEAAQFVGLVEEKTRHLDRLLEQLIESVDVLARAPMPGPVPLQALWEEVMATLQKKAGFERLTFLLQASPDLELWTDRACLRVVLTNLLTNAIDFRNPDDAQPHRCTVTVSHEAGGDRIEVADNGIGMSPEVQARAFEMFYRGSLQAKGIGNGMGLYTAKKTIELIGGKVTLQSEEGKGAKFILWLPGK